MDKAKRIDAFVRVRNSVRNVKWLEQISEDKTLKKSIYIERMLAQERARLKQYEEEAKPYLEGLKHIEYAFVIAYYFYGETTIETARIIDRSVRQCERIRRKFHKWKAES